MAIWPWVGWLVDGKLYGDSAEFLQVKDRNARLSLKPRGILGRCRLFKTASLILKMILSQEYKNVCAWSKRVGERPAVCLGMLQISTCFNHFLKNPQGCGRLLNLCVGWILECLSDTFPVPRSVCSRSASLRKRGVMVNRPFGEKSSQLHNRHARSDFETKTQVALESV